MASKEVVPALLITALGINLFNFGFQIGNITGKNSEDADARIRDIQARNAQVYEQLEPTYHGLGQLVLNDETDTFEFHVTPEGEQPQVCEGSYSISDGIARATGNIACTTQTKVGGN